MLHRPIELQKLELDALRSRSRWFHTLIIIMLSGLTLLKLHNYWASFRYLNNMERNSWPQTWVPLGTSERVISATLASSRSLSCLLKSSGELFSLEIISSTIPRDPKDNFSRIKKPSRKRWTVHHCQHLVSWIGGNAREIREMEAFFSPFGLDSGLLSFEDTGKCIE